MSDLSRITLRLPVDLKCWFSARASYNAASLNNELVRALREKMEKEARKISHGSAA